MCYCGRPHVLPTLPATLMWHRTRSRPGNPQATSRQKQSLKPLLNRQATRPLLPGWLHWSLPTHSSSWPTLAGLLKLRMGQGDSCCLGPARLPSCDVVAELAALFLPLWGLAGLRVCPGEWPYLFSFPPVLLLLFVPCYCMACTSETTI